MFASRRRKARPAQCVQQLPFVSNGGLDQLGGGLLRRDSDEEVAKFTLNLWMRYETDLNRLNCSLAVELGETLDGAQRLGGHS